jgi:CheY-like chemotaxis protein
MRLPPPCTPGPEESVKGDGRGSKNLCETPRPVLAYHSAHVRDLIDKLRATRLLVVDPDPTMRAALAAAVDRSGRVDACSSFQSARSRLDSNPYDFLVTAVRLTEYNGLHLVHLAKHARPATDAIVYDERVDLGFIAEVRRACAFFEPAHKIAVTLPAYLGASLPATDRRTPTLPDRRLLPRGGRRLWDRHRVGLPSNGPRTGWTPAKP